MYKLGKVEVGGKTPVRIMGILNSSPESFYKNSVKTTKQAISDTVKKMELEGADFIDVGGMSTAPYLKTLISEKLEAKRVTYAIKIIQNKTNLPISVDTCRSFVAKKALDLGVEIINDISGLKYDKEMAKTVSNYNISLVLGAFSPKPVRGDNIRITKDLLKQSMLIAKNSGICKNKIVLDPSIGFFRKSGNGPFFTRIKSDWVDRDLLILVNLKKIKQKNPILISVSNKSFIGKILNKEKPNDRLFGSLAVEALCVLHGADIIRTHNVAETNDIIKITSKFVKRHKGL